MAGNTNVMAINGDLISIPIVHRPPPPLPYPPPLWQYCHVAMWLCGCVAVWLCGWTKEVRRGSPSKKFTGSVTNWQQRQTSMNRSFTK